MAKGDTQDRIKRGIQPGLAPVSAVKGLTIGPSFDELSGGNPKGSNTGKHDIGPNKNLINKYNSGVPNG